MSTTIEPDAIYTTAEAAGILRCSRANIYDLIARKDIAYIRVGAGSKGYRVRGSAILAFVESRTEGGPAPRMALRNFKL